ncbi:MAG: TRAP transporter permease [Syntrophales bacterium]
MDEAGKKKADLELEESAGKMRRLTGFWGSAAAVLAAGTTLYHILDLTVFLLDPWLFLGYSVGLFSILTFLLFPGTKKGRKGVQAIDIVLSLLSIAVMAYLTLNYQEMYYRVGFDPATEDWVFGLIAIGTVLEMTRRLMGLFFPIMALFFILYAIFGGALPGIFGHRGYELSRTVSTIFSTEGLYGSAMSAAATYIVLFVTFGAFVRATGVGKFFIDLATSIAGMARGGPAKVAVFASALFGMVSGSSMGNAVTVGSLTIPLMKHVGYRPAFAGAVEAAASTGGQIMPPVMGSVAFVLAEATLTPYREVMLAAAIPAICYFACVYFMVDFEALKTGLKGMPRAEMPSFRGTLRKDWLLLLPILVLVYLIVVAGRSVIMAAIACMFVALVVDLIRRKKWMGWKEIFTALQEGSIGTLEAAGACAAAGIIIDIFTMTGLGNRFVDVILLYGRDSLFLCLILVTFVCLLLGCPLPTVPAYILTAALGAPVLVNLGVPVLAAHLFIMYFACVSTITPPVAFTAYAAAGIAKADPNETGWIATRLGIAAYIIPFAFVYNPAILAAGRWYEVLWATLMGLLCGYALACGINSNYRPVLRATVTGAALVLLIPGVAANLAGIVLVAGVVFLQNRLTRTGQGAPEVNA